MAVKSKKLIWYKRYPSNFIAGTTMLADYEKGVYSTIIDLLYDKGAPIEDSPVDLARICGCSGPKRFQTIRDRLVKLGKITVRDGLISNAVFEKDRGGPLEEVPEKEVPDLLDFKGLADPKSQRLEVRKKVNTKCLLAPDWKPSPEGVAYAVSKGFTETEVPLIAEAFVQHHCARNNSMVWDFAWMTWIRNEIKFGRPSLRQAPQSNGSGRGGKTTFGDMAREGATRLMGEHDVKKH